jgi:hypothetical protein
MPMYAPFSDRSIHHFELVRTILQYILKHINGYEMDTY